jgi:hypothetical protein
MDKSEEWLRIIKCFQNNDVYYYPQYLKAYEENGDGEPILFYLESEYGRLCNVFLKRDISNDNYFSNILEKNRYFDISTVYGYGGPIYESNLTAELAREYSSTFTEYCQKNNIISEFIRFHPLLENHVLLLDYSEVYNPRSTVCIDLTNGEEGVLKNLKSENRTRIRKAIKSGVEIVFGRDKFLIDEFKKMYENTMIRDNASQYYFFNKSFFNTTLEQLSENSFIAAAKYNNEIISTSIILFNDKYIHYHFGGSDKKYMNLAPNNLLFYEVAKWGCRTGRQYFHLGGGYKGDEDPLFRFKKSFSRGTPLSFYIGKKVYNYDLYNSLVLKKLESGTVENSNEHFFPAYRK